MGVINIDAGPRNGEVVGARVVCEGDELMLVTERGIVIRQKVADVRQTGRNAAGVRLIRLDKGDKLVAMAKVPAGEESDAETTPPPPADDAGRNRFAQSDDAPPADAHGQPDAEESHDGGSE